MTVEQKAQHITLCCSLIKQDKFEWMLQKACELGVTRIVPLNRDIQLFSWMKRSNKRSWNVGLPSFLPAVNNAIEMILLN